MTGALIETLADVSDRYTVNKDVQNVVNDNHEPPSQPWRSIRMEARL